VGAEDGHVELGMGVGSGKLTGARVDKSG
jgi:hypothetical protein